MKKENPLDIALNEVARNLSSIQERTLRLSDTSTIEELNFEKQSIFWENQKDEMEKMMDSLRYDLDRIKKDISMIIINAEKIIADFRNKSKMERIEVLKRKIDSTKFEEYLTKKRFLELLRKEILKNAAQNA